MIKEFIINSLAWFVVLRMFFINFLSILQHGFTLVEILVVVAIIGILASIIVPKLTSKVDDARVQKAHHDIKVISSVLELLALCEPGFKYKYSLPHGSSGSVFKYGPTNTFKPCSVLG
jgi:prepilin-type N-terminal cleavage/methylation domain-containing protein